MRTTLIVMLTLLLGGCASGPSPQRGGIATIGTAIMAPFKWLGGGASNFTRALKPINAANPAALTAPNPTEGLSITQPDNPGSTSAQNYDYENTDELTFSAPTTITETVQTPNGGTLTRTINVPAGSKKLSKETQKVGQTLGASRVDTTKATANLLGSFKAVQMAGVLFLLAGVLGFAHPAVRLLIGGKDTAMAVGLCGIGMISGPFILVQYANYFFGLIVCAALYWGVSRLKYKEAEADTLKKAATTPPFPPTP